ncbi:VWA domain-containing protein [Algisphaera agarilytica]|uniref:Mg-chelatase subunit ChlD n=1 Tax=Algisphaera agarilytica TaxID=1385975 RepID=A0A7X0LKD7_9BACT|nr:VWA domain-containing protein [Algisphaera agarilytica]MBB6430320.1 Mg-chelatase subunit ChlD [Algisphaera agarilytica]
MNFRLDHPELLLLLLLVLPIGWLGWKYLATVEPIRRGLAIGLRVGVLVLLVLMLAGLRAEQRHTELTVIAVVDQSPSMSVFGEPPVSAFPNQQPINTSANRSMSQAIRDFLVAASEDKQPDDRFGVVTYDNRPTVVTRPGNEVRLDPSTGAQVREGTDTAKALEWAMAAKSDANTALRLVLVTDGNDTSGDTLAAARNAAAAGVVIDVLPIDYRVGEEVMVEGVYTPIEAREGQTVAVRVVLRGTAPARGQLQLKHDGRVLDLNGAADGKGIPIVPSDWSDSRALTEQQQDAQGNEIAVVSEVQSESGRYVLAKQIDVPIFASGANRFEAVFEPAVITAPVAVAGSATASSDSVVVNNSAESFTLVQGRGRVLLVDNVGGAPGSILPEALQQRQINLDVIPPGDFPRDTAALTRYDAVIFQNVPAEAITGQQQTMLARYVNDLGGGFIMLGGPDSFGAGGWTNSIIDQSILPVDCEIPSQTVLPSGALAIVIDRSGSMGAPVGNSGKTQQEIASEAAALAVQTLYQHDMIGVVAFDSFSQWVVPMQRNRNPQAVMRTLRSINPGGGTSILAGLERAYEGLIQNTQDLRESSIKHIILLSDGGADENFLPIINKLNRANISVSTIGVGDGHRADILEALALAGGGEYHPVLDPNDLPQVFVKEARTIRKNLIKEIEFTPQRRNTGSPIMANLPSTPSLNGLVLTGPKYDRRIDMPLLGPEGEPLFAHWQVGLGKSAAWTSDATNKWATPWLNWGGYGDFWARTVRYVSRPSASQQAELTATVEGDQLRVRLDVPVDAEAEQSAGAGAAAQVIQGKVLRPDGNITDIDLKQVGPGLYEALAPATETGSYILNLFMGTPGGEQTFIAGGATRAAGEELRKFKPNTQLLREIAATTGGRVLDPADPVAASLFDRTHRFESVSTRPLRWTLLPWLLGLLLLDVANRRIAWDHRAIAAWAKQKMSVQRRTATETKQTMSALKKRRKSVQHSGAEGAQASNGDAFVPVPEKKKKFEAAAGTKVSADFADAVGGAKAASESSSFASQAKPQSETPPEEATTANRLLAAKRRAREKNQ